MFHLDVESIMFGSLGVLAAVLRQLPPLRH